MKIVAALMTVLLVSGCVHGHDVKSFHESHSAPEYHLRPFKQSVLDHEEYLSDCLEYYMEECYE
jgi:G:T-mismatch repair DNA endonuclease (very short patch repair protein)